jgi:hypothetical protein
MVLADSGYPALSVMWSIFIFFGWVMFIWLLITVYMDLFRRNDIGGWGKTGWVLFTIVLPLIGALAYLLAYGEGMSKRSVTRSLQHKHEFDDYIRSQSATSSQNGADEIAKAQSLLDQGAITKDEYEFMKHRALAA